MNKRYCIICRHRIGKQRSDAIMYERQPDYTMLPVPSPFCWSCEHLLEHSYVFRASRSVQIVRFLAFVLFYALAVMNALDGGLFQLLYCYAFAISEVLRFNRGVVSCPRFRRRWVRKGWRIVREIRDP